MNKLAAPLLLFVLLPADDKPTPKFPLGKETTYITEPLDKDGYLDYQAALNDRLGKGITPEKNANVLIWKALGPRPEGGKGMPAELFKRLGIDAPPEKGDYFVGLHAYMKDHAKLDPGEFGAIDDQLSEAVRRPWAAKNYPHITAWLKDNEKPLAIVVEATKRPDYFNPLVSHPANKGPGGLMGALLPSAQKCRELASAFAARAMFRAGEGKFDDAWQDLLACHRLGRLVSRGATLIESLVGVAIEQVASNADLAYIECAGLTAKRIQDCLKDLQGLPPISPLADKIDFGERFIYLDSAQLVRRGGFGMVKVLEGMPGETGAKPSAEELKALEEIDWEPALRDGNRWYDRLAAAHRLKNRADRERELEKINKDLRILAAELVESLDSAKLLRGKEAPQKVGKVIGNVLIRLLVPATHKAQPAYDRMEQVQHNLRVAFALAAYHSENGRYPAKLDDLAPRYLPAVPDDLFSGKALIYRSTEKGYLFYSVGFNGKDDEGRWRDDDPPGDDIGIRMPLPELKKKK